MSQDAIIYRCASDVEWVKDAGQTILVSEAGCSWRLDGWRAAVWDLLSLGYPAEDIVRFLSVLLDVPAETARTRLLTALAEWERDGVVRHPEGDGRG
jgi:hypothetical protein